MWPLAYLAKPVGFTKLAMRMKIKAPTLRSIAKGLKAPTLSQRTVITKVYNTIQYRKLRVAGFNEKMATRFKSLTPGKINDRLAMMENIVNNMAATRRTTASAIRKSMAKSTKTWRTISQS